jgi:hypothetical protein
MRRANGTHLEQVRDIERSRYWYLGAPRTGEGEE